MNNKYNVYVGARYVPILMGEWDNSKEYEPLSIVINEGDSYTSKTYVPVGVGLDNETYWVRTGQYNAQVANISREVAGIKDEIADFNETVDDIEGKVDGIESNVEVIEGKYNNLETVVGGVSRDLAETNSNVANLNTEVDDIGENVNALAGAVQNIYNIKTCYELRGKKILVLGDSTADETVTGRNWVTAMREMLPDATIDNRAVSGSTFAKDIGVQSIVYDVLPSITNLNSYDYIIVLAGTNDQAHQIRLGDFNSANQNEFNGALTQFANYVDANFEGKVIMLTPLKCVHTAITPTPNPLIVYANAIFQRCVQMGYMCIDTHSFAPLLNPANPLSQARYIADKVHPNASYAEILGQFVINKIYAGGDSALASWREEWSLPVNDSSLADVRVTGLFYGDGRDELVIKWENTQESWNGSHAVCKFPVGFMDHTMLTPSIGPNGELVSYGVLPDGSGGYDLWVTLSNFTDGKVFYTKVDTVNSGYLSYPFSL